MTHKELKFESLFKKALNEWPGELKLDLEDQVLTEVRPTDKGYDLCAYQTIQWDGNPEKYVVKNLYDICEKISEIHLDTEEEVIWIHIHDAIDKVIYSISLFTTYIFLKNLRLAMVKQEFEFLLKGILKDTEPVGWRLQDIQLIKQYFEANPSVSESNGDNSEVKS